MIVKSSVYCEAITLQQGSFNVKFKALSRMFKVKNKVFKVILLLGTVPISGPFRPGVPLYLLHDQPNLLP